MNEYELYHHGILGMKWGIRRYQNEDGTLTEAGKKRYRTNDKFAQKYDKGVMRSKYAEANKAENLKKRFRELHETDKTPNANALRDKVAGEVAETKEAQAAERVQEFLKINMKQAQALGYRQIYLDQSTAEWVNRVNNAYYKKVEEYVNNNIEDMASAFLKDLGYEDTEAGREYLKKHDFLHW